MARKLVEIHAAEAGVIQDLFRERDLAVKALTEIVRLICGRENIPVAMLAGLDGNSLVLDVPDDAPESDFLALGPMDVAGADETPSESKLAPVGFTLERHK